MPTDQNPKQQIAQRLKDAMNILVTVSHNPGVDELSAALALTLMLDKMGKTPTAVVSGKIPPAIEFLNPGKTFDTNVDGLRDFIIALDKSKADRLRYKVEDDLVRVFITPYKTTITEKDLSFSLGDFNVDLVVAFGVEKREDLDTAIAAHGRILHDATVVTINQNRGENSLGEINWIDPEASSLCEMLMSLTEALQSGLVDQPAATAILTGLVSVTDRFRNEKTTPKVMTMAAQLMAAGANQQLIANKLEEAESVTTGKLNDEAVQPQDKEAPKQDDGEMRVEHEGSDTDGIQFDTPPKDAVEEKAREVETEESKDAVQEAKKELAKGDQPAKPVKPADESVVHSRVSSWRDATPPMTGGSLSATSEQAVADKQREEREDKNRVILSHDNPEPHQPASPAMPAVLNSTTLESPEPTVKDIFASPAAPSEPVISTPIHDIGGPIAQPANIAQTSDAPVSGSSTGLKFEEIPLVVPSVPVQTNSTLSDLEAEVQRQASAQIPTPQSMQTPLDNARAAVDAAFGSQPFNPAGQPLVSAGSQQLGSISHDTPVSSAPVSTPVSAQPGGMPPLPPLPPLPDFSTLPPLPGETAHPVSTQPMPSFGLPEQPVPNIQHTQTPQAASQGSVTSDPGQFKLPGQS